MYEDLCVHRLPAALIYPHSPGFERQNVYWDFSKANFSRRFAYAGEFSAEILSGQHISQSFQILEGGRFKFTFVGQAYRPGAIVSFLVNGTEKTG